MDYTEADAVADSKLLIGEICDISIEWINIVSDGNSDSVEMMTDDNNLSTAASPYCRVQGLLSDLRYLRFAAHSLSCEMHQLSNQRFHSVKEKGKPMIIANPLSNESASHISSPAMTDTQVETTVPELTRTIPFAICVKDISDIDAMVARDETLDQKLKQLRKDIQRDRILLNGTRIVGSEVGLDETVAYVKSVIDKAIEECQPLPKQALNVQPSTDSAGRTTMQYLSEDEKDTIALHVLRKASRTHAGGVTFQALRMHLVDPMNTAIVPLSTITPPLKVRVSIQEIHNVSAGCSIALGSADAGKGNNTGVVVDTKRVSGSGEGRNYKREWGLVCKIEVASVFQFKAMMAIPEDMNGQSGRIGFDTSSSSPPTLIGALYEDCVTCAFPVHEYTLDMLQDEDMLSGRVTFSRFQS